jgi:Kef-type K+ transport system membrane component KefB
VTLSASELSHLLLALMLLLSAAHACGYLFARFGQPRVVGEILGGLLLGPTAFGALLPAAQAFAFPAEGSVPAVLDALYQLGLLLLMFGAGAELRSSFQPGEGRTVAAVTVAGVVIPFAVGLGFVAALPSQELIGAANSRAAFVLVFSLAIAVTSIPVISRIMGDLGILDTPFARVVLAVAVIEDVIVYVILAIAIGLVAAPAGHAFGLPALLRLEPGAAASVAYHAAVTLAFLALARGLGPAFYRRVRRLRYNLVRRGSLIGFQLAFLLAVSVLATGLGVVPLFGAFVAGLVVGASGRDGAAEARETIRAFALAFFVPLYFALVGLRLDLLHGFSPLFFALFFAVACLAKAASVWAGARLAGETERGARNLAVALNARGGPGIVLASVAFDHAIISQPFYAVLVLLAILTSLLAGAWLERAVRSGAPLR